MDYLFDQIEKVLGRLRSAECIFFFLDYDGTLTPIVPHPEDANLSKEMRDILLELKKDPRTFLAIISGRSLKNIQDRVGLKGIYYVGNHGLEIFEPKKGVKRLFPKKVVRELREIRDRLNNPLREIEGIVIEDKGCILAIHYRNVDLRRVPPILMAIKQEIKNSMVPLCLGSGKYVFEVRPKSTVNKGTAVLTLLDQTDQDGVLPLYIGDDQTDEDAFRVSKKRGITIFVGSPSLSSAQYYVKDSSEVYQFLKIAQARFE